MKFHAIHGLVLSLTLSLTAYTLAQGVQPYPNARTDKLVQPETPMLPPPINTPFVDPDFGETMVRVTDSTTTLSNRVHFFRTEASGNQNAWSTDSSKFYFEDDVGRTLVFGFDPSTLKISSLPGAVPGQPLTVPLRPGAIFSFQDPDLIYGTTSRTPLTISAFRFSTGKSFPILDTTTCGTVPAIGGGSGPMNGTQDDLSLSLDDSRMALSEVGPQFGAVMFMVVYDKVLGCRWYNTQTGQIGGAWGATGTASGPLAPYYIQRARLSRSGNYVKIEKAPAPNVPNIIYVWDVVTLSVTPCVKGSRLHCFGYGSVGYNTLINDGGYIDEMNIIKHPLNSFAQISQLAWPLTPPYHWDQEHHFTWSNVNATDSTPICLSGYNYDGDPIANAYDGEIMCVETDLAASTVWRFAHNRAPYVAPYFNTQPLGNVSMDGRLFLFTSSWDLQVGTMSNGGPRSDVWVVNLQ